MDLRLFEPKSRYLYKPGFGNLLSRKNRKLRFIKFRNFLRAAFIFPPTINNRGMELKSRRLPTHGIDDTVTGTTIGSTMFRVTCFVVVIVPWDFVRFIRRRKRCLAERERAARYAKTSCTRRSFRSCDFDVLYGVPGDV